MDVLGMHRDRAIAIVDIESGSIGITIIAVGSGPSRIIAHARSVLSLQASAQNLQTAGIVAQIRETGARVLDTYTKSGTRLPITSMYCVLHAPHARSSIQQASQTFPEETYIHEGHIHGLLQNALANRKNVDRTRIFEAGLLKVELNGYPTNKPEGKYAHQIDVFSIASESDPALRDATTGALWEMFPAAAVTWRSGMRALLTVEREISSQEHSYVGIDIGTDTTQIMVIEEGALIAECSIAEGTRTMLTRVGADRAPDETFGYMRMLARGACESETCLAVQEALAASESDLARVFGEALGSIATARRLPNTLVLVAHPDLAEWLSGFFARIDFTQFTVTTLPFSVQALVPADMGAWISNPEQLDPSLAVAASLVNIEIRA